MGLQRGAPQPWVRQDLVEIGHQLGFGQDGQLVQPGAGDVTAEPPPVVRRYRGGVAQQRMQAVLLVRGEPVGRPADVRDQLGRELPRRAGAAGGVAGHRGSPPVSRFRRAAG
jgi:hypothetical protein